MLQDCSGSLSQLLKMSFQISEQHLKRAAVMIMGHGSSGDPPEPFNAIGVRMPTSEMPLRSATRLTVHASALLSLI
jgi:hypothetical protein